MRQANQLIHALVDENRRIRQDLTDGGDLGLGATIHGVFVPMSSGNTAAADAAQSFNRRKLNVAAGVLTGDQLAVFQKLFADTVELRHLMRDPLR